MREWIALWLSACTVAAACAEEAGRTSWAPEQVVAAAAGETQRLPQGLQAAALLALEVSINATPVGTWEVLRHEGSWWVTDEAMQAWRLLMPTPARPLMHRQRLWWPLHAVPGYRARFDEVAQALAVDVLPVAFRPTALRSGQGNRPLMAEAIPALFLNYDLSATALRSAGETLHDAGLLTELGLSSSAGVLLSTQVIRWASKLAQTGLSGAHEFRRLETNWTHEWPQMHVPLRLRVGDSWTRATMWGRQAAFAGLQIGTAQDVLGPMGAGLSTPLLAGQALTPSTVELYVNEALRQVVQVPAGPFTLENTAPLSGAGQARLVVRDVLGRESVVVQPFFVDPQLLAPGATQWSAEAGRVRRGLGFGATDDGYGLAFAQAWMRRGLGRAVTMESRLQGRNGLTRLDMAAALSVADRALMQVGWAGSASEGRRGSSGLLALQTQSERGGASLRVAGSSRDLAEVGLLPMERAPRWEGSLAMRRSLPGGHGIGATLAHLQRQDGTTLRTALLSFTQRMSDWGQLLWSASRLQSSSGPAYAGAANPLAVAGWPASRTLLQVMAVVPFDSRVTRGTGARPVATAQLIGQPDSQGRQRLDAVATAHAPVGLDGGWGWRAVAGHRAGQTAIEGGAQRLTDTALWGLDVSAVEGQSTALRAQVQGAWVWAAGALHAARRIQESFALVEVLGHEGVPIALDGPAVTATDARGMALLPRLMPHQPNRVRLDPNALPLDSEIETLERSVVPPWRSAVRVDFAVRPGRAALVTIELSSGAPAPRGAVLRLQDESREFVVGGRGEVYVTGLAAHEPRRATLEWTGHRCTLEMKWVRHAPDPEALTRLGPYRCVEQAP